MATIPLLILVLIQTSDALIGYDCGSTSLNVTTLSLLEVGPCQPPPDTVNVTRRYIQLLQINDFLETNVIQCKLEVHRTVYYCGMHSHISIVNYGETEYIAEISHERCVELYHTGVIKIGNSNVISGVKTNVTSTHPIIFAGTVGVNGYCSGTSYSDPYGSWDSVVVQGTVKITVQKQKARVDIESNKIHLRSGTMCILSDSTCIDTEGGYTFWRPIPVDSCNFRQYGILYEGLANKIVDTEYNHEQIVYSLATKEVTFALASRSKEMVCGYTLIRTEHPKLIIFETVKGESFANKDKIDTDNLDIFAYVNSKFVYVEKHIKTQIKSLYREVVMQRCALERQTLKNALTIATQAPDQFAYSLMKGPGYMAVTAGEVVHIIKCVPVEVKVIHGEECFTELEVSRRNTTYYLTPRTHVLKLRGTKTTCNPILPAIYQIDEGWYKILPRPTETLRPWTIKPMIKPSWRYVSPAYLATSGIYTEKDLSELRDRIMFPVERPALLNDVAREMHGHPVSDKDGTLVRLLSENAMEKIVESTWGKMWSKFMTFGTASAGVIAIFAIIHIIKTIIEIIINGFALHRIYGWSLHMLGALWGVITRLLIAMNNGPPQKTEPKELIPTEEEMQDLTEVVTEPKPTPKSNETAKTEQSTFFTLSN